MKVGEGLCGGGAGRGLARIVHCSSNQVEKRGPLVVVEGAGRGAGGVAQRGRQGTCSRPLRLEPPLLVRRCRRSCRPPSSSDTAAARRRPLADDVKCPQLVPMEGVKFRRADALHLLSGVVFVWRRDAGVVTANRVGGWPSARPLRARPALAGQAARVCARARRVSGGRGVAVAGNRWERPAVGIN